MYTEPQLLPLSALQHLLYCPRQCALIHIERAWADNRFTAEGNALHKNAHTGKPETRPGIRITRTLPLRSLRLGLSGQADIVEFQSDGTVLPVEYKRGKPKAHAADEVQLCAQALCLEEMLTVHIPQGFLFYGKNQRRHQVTFDEALRHLTADTAEKLHHLIGSKRTPTALYEPKKCTACSLIEICQPKTSIRKRTTTHWFESQLQQQ